MFYMNVLTFNKIMMEIDMPSRHRKFKNRDLQKMYDIFRELDAPGDDIRGRGAASNAFFVGYHYPDASQKIFVRNSLAYAAYAAGVDKRNEDNRKATK